MIVNENFQAWIEGKVAKFKSRIQPKSSEVVDNAGRIGSGASERDPDSKTEKKQEVKPSKEEHSTYDEHEEKGSTPDAKEKRGDGDEDDDDDDGPMDLSWPSDKGCFGKFLHIVSFPIKVLERPHFLTCLNADIISYFTGSVDGHSAGCQEGQAK